MATPSQTKLFFLWYTSNLQPRGNNKVTIEGYMPWIQPRPHLHVCKRNFIPTLCFRVKKADELVRELRPDEIHRKSSIRLCWLCIAQLFRLDLWGISDLCLLNPMRFRAWVYRLKPFNCTSCPRRSDLPILTSFMSLLKQDTTRKGWVYKYYKLGTKSYIDCRSNSFPDPVLVELEE